MLQGCMHCMALGLSCSDGTFIGSLGVWGFGDNDFVDLFVVCSSTTFDGYTGITAGLDANGCVDAISFISRDEDGAPSPLYGAANRNTVTTSCREDERIVGLAARSSTSTGNIGAFGLLCGKVVVADVTERSDEVPARLEGGLWRFDYQCPEQTYITRFFGRAGSGPAGLINSLTAQCSRTWNLKTAGVPGYAQPSDAAYSHTSLEGYSGINAQSYTGSLDSMQFVTPSGAVSPVYGNSNITTPAVQLRCGAASHMIGIFGWQDSYVSSIGIICSIGEFAPLATSARVLRLKRNPEASFRIPGRAVAAATVSGITPQAVQQPYWPSQRIPTRVSGPARQPEAPAVGPVSNSSMPLQDQNHLLPTIEEPLQNGSVPL